MTREELLKGDGEISVTISLDDGTDVECSVVTVVTANGKDYAVLLPEDTRFESCWAVPRNKSGNKAKFGFSSDPVWFAQEPSADLWKKHFAEQISAYSGDNWLLPDEEADDNG